VTTQPAETTTVDEDRIAVLREARATHVRLWRCGRPVPTSIRILSNEYLEWRRQERARAATEADDSEPCQHCGGTGRARKAAAG
jgi:Ribonuclease G/E